MNVRLITCCLALAGLIAPAAGATDLNVLAAASLTDSLKEIARNYQRLTGDRIVLNLGSSNTLARQIEQGAPADLFLSADEAKMNALQREGLIFDDTRRSILSNTLVIITSASSPLRLSSPNDLKNRAVRSIALADPQVVPSGLYAKHYLKGRNIWPALAGKIIPTDNVRATLAAVEAGNVGVGIVYRTDALISRKVRIVHEIPRSEGPRISYPFAVVRESAHPAAARKFLAYLSSRAARDVFAKHGFIVR